MKTMNKQIAVEPIVSNSIKISKSQGIATASQNNLMELTVVLPDDSGVYRPGDKIYVLGQGAAHAWAKTVYDVADVKFCLVPEQLVVMVNLNEASTSR